MFEADQNDRTGLAATGRLLGALGLIPFVVLSLWLYAIPADHVWRSQTIALLCGYGAVILSFLGGARWGLAISRPSDDGARTLTLAMAPPLVGWASLATPVPYAFAVLAVAFAAQGAWDAFAVHAGSAPHWYGRLRTMLTIVVVATMVLALVATS